MRSLRDPVARQEIVARIERLSAENQRRWGRMELPQMLAHLADQLRMAVGEVEVQNARGPFRFAPMRFLTLHVMPWPKAQAQAPHEAFTTPPTDVEADRRKLLDLIQRFVDTPESELRPLHPLFGQMTDRDWGVLSYRHLDHHLRQFSA